MEQVNVAITKVSQAIRARCRSSRTAVPTPNADTTYKTTRGIACCVRFPRYSLPRLQNMLCRIRRSGSESGTDAHHKVRSLLREVGGRALLAFGRELPVGHELLHGEHEFLRNNADGLANLLDTLTRILRNVRVQLLD